ncbi:ZNF76 [Cordylochernes scorpioides]|uniref:ZNF76 n=1 Tax=Cordylochernes scorpioides TaxID=51811 RepID=A0ABY6LJ25_9ARAC|nr:ZNF76 [Cordylochernes scorpioides]
MDCITVPHCPAPGEKPYQCPITGCQKRFTEYSSLYKHHVVHTHSQPYSCDLCGRNYRQTSTLALHKRTSHNIFPESPPPMVSTSTASLEEEVSQLPEVLGNYSRITWCGAHRPG